MRRILLTLVCGLVACSTPAPDQHPPSFAPLGGWFLSGPGQADFRAGADDTTRHGGVASGRLEATSSASNGAATLMQSIAADAYRGKRVRFGAWVRTRDLGGWTGLWMRVERKEGRVAFDNMQMRPIRGSTEWTRREIVLDVGRDATSIDFGLVQDGTGTSWIDDGAIESVSLDVPTTDLDHRPRALENPGFEMLGDQPSGWQLTGWSAPDFAIAVDRVEHHDGAASVRISNAIDTPRGRAGVVQHVLADAWHEKRVRISAAAKGSGNFYVSTLPFDAPRGHQGLTRGGCKTESAAWKACSVVLDVPARTDTLEIGMWTGGKSTAWLDDVAIEIVPFETPVTEVDERPRRLVNGELEGPIGSNEIAGWFMSGGSPSHYAATIDRVERHAGASSVRLTNAIPDPKGYATLMQGFLARDFRGKRVRMTSFVKGKGVDARGDVWLRVQGETSPGDGPGLAGGYCRLSGDFAWKPCTSVFDVPDDGDTIEIGVGLDGHGTIWFDDVKFEEVDLTVPITDPRTPREIENGGFEGDLPRTWFLSGGARAEFEAVTDKAEHATGASSVRLRPKGDAPKGYGTWMTSIDAASYRGKRMRLTARSKGAGITGRGDLWLRVQSQTSPGDGPGLGGGACKLHGTYDWKECTIVFDVPPRGDSIQLGAGLGGPGTIWLDDVVLEEVTAATPTTTTVTAPRTEPKNLGFEP